MCIDEERERKGDKLKEKKMILEFWIDSCRSKIINEDLIQIEFIEMFFFIICLDFFSFIYSHFGFKLLTIAPVSNLF